MNTRSFGLPLAFCNHSIFTDLIRTGIELGRPDWRPAHSVRLHRRFTAGKFGKPEVAFHYLNSGSVIGNDYQFSGTEGVCKHFEVGFTQSLQLDGKRQQQR